MELQLSIEKIKGKGPRSKMQDVGCFGKSADGLFSWMIVCDGIGGEHGGEVAADWSVKLLHRYFVKHLLDENQLSTDHFIKKGIQLIRAKFKELIYKDPSLHSMGCTLCITIFAGSNAYVFWSGDARCYLLRNSICIWDVLPHNWSFDLYRKGVLSLEEARLSETSFLTGSINNYSAEIRVDVEVLQLEKNDRLLLCTDGVWGLFEHPDLTQLIATKNLAGLTANLKRMLKSLANDNYYCFLIDCL